MGEAASAIPGDNPLLDLPADQQRILVELAEDRASGRINRRTLLRAGGVLGLGAVLGVGRGASGTAEASSDTSTDDSGANLVSPDPGTDIQPLADNNTAILLEPGANYVVGESICDYDRLYIGQPFGGLAGMSANLTWTGGAAPVVDWGSSALVVGSVIENVVIDGQDNATRILDGSGLRNRTVLRRVWGRRCTDHAFRVTDTFYTDMVQCVADAIGGDGFHFDSDDGEVTEFYLERPQVRTGAEKGIYVDGDVTVQTPVLENCQQEAIKQTDGTLTVNGLYIEGVATRMKTPVGVRLAGETAFINNPHNFRFGEGRGGTGILATGDVRGKVVGGRYITNGGRPDHWVDASDSAYFDVENIRSFASAASEDIVLGGGAARRSPNAFVRGSSGSRYIGPEQTYGPITIILDHDTAVFHGMRAIRPTTWGATNAIYFDDGSRRTAGWYYTTDGGRNWTPV